MALIVGILVGSILTPVVEELLPVDLRFRVLYARKRLTKLARPPSVRVGITAKTQDLSNQGLSPDRVMEQLEQAVLSHQLQPKMSKDEVGFGFEIGRTIVDGTLRLVTLPKDQTLIVSQLEAQVWGIFSYREFDTGMLELTESLHLVEDYLRIFPTSLVAERVLECKLSSLYELTGLLSKYNIAQLSASLGDNYRFELGRNGLTVYAQRVIDGNVISFLRKLITFYY